MFVLFGIGITDSVYAQEESVLPEWIRNIFVWYAEEEISESELLKAIEYLASEKIIMVNSGYACGPGTGPVDNICQIITNHSEGCAINENRTFGPSGYRSFEDSPFEMFKDCSTYFHLEDFENNGLLTPGVSSDGAGKIPSENTHSVDYDDGIMDGSGIDGHSFSSVDKTMDFTFNEQTLAKFPTFVGLVITYTPNIGAYKEHVSFEAYDSKGIPIDKITIGNYWNTGEDRFVGISHVDGIKLIKMEGRYSFEIDHLQYGR